MTDMTPITYSDGAYTAAQAEQPRPEENRQSRRSAWPLVGSVCPRGIWRHWHGLPVACETGLITKLRTGSA